MIYILPIENKSICNTIFIHIHGSEMCASASLALYWIRMCAQNLIVFVQIIGRFIHSTNQKLFVNKKSRNRAAAAAIAIATPLAPITQKCVGRKCVWTDVHAHICKMVCLYTLTH